jgi:putative transport protein
MHLPVPVTDDTVIQHNDVVTLYGSEQDIQRAAALAGRKAARHRRCQASVGRNRYAAPAGRSANRRRGRGLIGLLVLRIGSVPLTLGSGGGALLSGLLFGWYQA